MLPANLISALQALSNSGKPLITATPDKPNLAVTEESNLATKFEPGQQFQATVQSRVSEGVYKVQIAGQTIQMRLPSNIQTGEGIKLEVISTKPRITFSMVASTNPLSTPEQIGASARMLSNLADLPIERPIVQQLGKKAVWQADQPLPDTKLLAGALRETLGKSGLFYESHQAQWIRGERSTSQLLEEPQNVLTGNNLLSSNTKNPAAYSAQSEPGFSGTQSMQQPLSPVKAQDTASGQATANGKDIAVPVTKELLHLVQQQLHTLENHHLVWLGQIWPGQQMQWEIQGGPEHHAQQQDERQWSTEMELALPKLGDIHARLVFAKSGLKVTLRAADSKTVDLFNRALPMLKDSLANADITMISAVAEKT